jgi:drug/metabolite transporter (DMT)-like permease
MNRLGKVVVALTVVLWSTGNLIVRDSPLTGPQIAFWRYLLAAIGYAAIHRAAVGPIRWTDMKKAAPTAIAISLEVVVFFVAIKRTTIANVTVIGALMPLLLFGVATKRFAERIPLRVIVATLVALLGVAAVVFGGPGGAEVQLGGDALAVVALLLFAAYFTFAKIARETMSAFTLQTHSLLIGVPIVFVVTVIDSRGLTVPRGGEWWHVAGLIAFPTTGHLLINWAHAHVSLTLSSLMTLGVPVLSILGAAVFFDETLVAPQVAGISLVLVVLGWAIVQTNRIRPEGTSTTP